MFTIQRVPRGLSDLLSIFGGRQPQGLEESVRPTLDLLQFYGLTQRQTLFTGGTVTEGNSVSLTMSAQNWTVLFGVHASFTKTATLTALNGAVFLDRSSGGSSAVNLCLFSEDFTAFGATVTGVVNVGGLLPYAMACPPGSRVLAVPQIIGTDANNAIGLTAEFGVLG